MDRLTLAYLLIASVVVALTGLVSLKLYHSRERTYRRRQQRDEADYECRMADQVRTSSGVIGERHAKTRQAGEPAR